VGGHVWRWWVITALFDERQDDTKTSEMSLVAVAGSGSISRYSRGDVEKSKKVKCLGGRRTRRKREEDCQDAVLGSR
jgi:hypothetical protein